MKKRYLHLASALLLLLITHAAYGQTIFIDYRSAWKYLDNGSNQGTAWTAPAFNDAAWASDTGWFGYGDAAFVTKLINACGTVVVNPSCTNKYITTYFRKVVNIPNIALYDSMRMNIIRDDAVAVYVNGVEVWRCPNMPTGTLSYTTTALSAIGNAAETTAVTRSIPISYFVNGNNTIAVELHQESGSSSDVNFNMQMISVPSPLIFGFGDPWKYLATATDQGTAWRGTSFNDAAWSTGTGHIGYGESWTTTCIPAGASGCTACPAAPGSCTKYTTTYFRKTVNIPSLSAFDSMMFSVFRDDGIVMYVNGTEVWRDNMPTGTVSYSTLAPNNITNPTPPFAESLAVVKSIPISAFVAGSNTIAIELHQNSATSSDLDFNVRMEGVRAVVVTPVTLTFGPYLQMGGQTAVNVRWRTNIVSKSRVIFGTTLGTYPIIVTDNALVTDHELRVTGLTPDTKYYYRFGTDTSIIQGDSTNFFTTAPVDTSTRRVTVAFFGDCGQNNLSYQTATLAAYRTFLAANGMKAADLMLLGGDNAYDNGTDAQFSSKFFVPYSGSILKNHMLFPTPGNHDYDNGARFDIGVPYFSLFSTPAAGESGGVPSGTEAYYSYNWGNVHFLSLDSYGKGDANTTRMSDTNGAQVAWV